MIYADIFQDPYHSLGQIQEKSLVQDHKLVEKTLTAWKTWQVFLEFALWYGVPETIRIDHDQYWSIIGPVVGTILIDMVDHVDKPSRKKTRAVFGVDGLEWFSVYSFQILHMYFRWAGT